MKIKTIFYNVMCCHFQFQITGPTLGVHACLQCIASLTKMKIIDRDNHGAFDEHISDDNDGNDEASFDS